MQWAADAQKVTLLSLLDLSTAFDCVDHQLLLQRLRHDFGLTDTVLAWIRAGLTMVPNVPWHRAPRCKGPPAPRKNFSGAKK